MIASPKYMDPIQKEKKNIISYSKWTKEKKLEHPITPIKSNQITKITKANSITNIKVKNKSKMNQIIN